jgi:alkylation response protein AidB-like acyl-CoA dehydrogenase
VFLSGSNGRRGILANGPGERNRPGTATQVEGGYQVSGRWNFASGIRHASWVLAICRLHAPDGEPIVHAGDPAEYTPGAEGLFSGQRPAERLMLVPIEQATLIDTWHVSGLRGTGSFSFSLSDVFVPGERCISVSPSARCERGPLYQFSSSGVFGPTFGGVALGVAGAALEAFVDFAGGKTPRGAQSSLRDSPTVQARVARARARLGAAQAYLYQTLDQVWSGLVATGGLDLEARVAQRLAATHATHQALRVVDEAYSMAGSNAIFAEQPFERRFRDLHAVSQQLQARAAHYETAGRFLLGLDPQSPFI